MGGRQDRQGITSSHSRLVPDASQDMRKVVHVAIAISFT
jgi:hypothetical protein